MRLEIQNQSGQLKFIEVPHGTKIVIVEGFESVGKTTIMDRLVERSQYIHSIESDVSDEIKEEVPLVNLWKPNYSTMTKSFLPYEGRYILNLALFDLIMQSAVTLPSNEVLVVDRGLISGMVYSALKGQSNQEYLLSSDFLDHVEKIYSSDFVYHLYVQPKSEEDVFTLFELSKSDKLRDNDEYDLLEDFKVFYDEYLDSNELFMKNITDVCGGRYSVVDPMTYDVESAMDISSLIKGILRDA